MLHITLYGIAIEIRDVRIYTNSKLLWLTNYNNYCPYSVSGPFGKVDALANAVPLASYVINVHLLALRRILPKHCY